MDSVYSERSRLVAYLAALHPSGWGVDPAEPDWPVVYVQTPEGQMSWHISPDDFWMFAYVPRDDSIVFDGHTTDEKYARLGRLTYRAEQERK